MSRVLAIVLAAATLSGCAAFAPATPPPAAPAAAVVDSLVDDPVRERQLEGALAAARWRLLRGLDERVAGRFDGAREELDQAYYTLAAVDDNPALDHALPGRDVQAEVDAVATSVERAYLEILPHVESLSPDSPLSLLLNDLADEQLEELPPDAVPLVRIHQLAPLCDLPIDANAQVASSIHFFQTRGRRTWEVWHQRSGRYRDMIVPILREAGLPEDLFYLSMIESGFNPRAYSRAHASGLWQFVRSTGRLEGLRIDSMVDERRDPLKSTRAAAQHLESLYREFGDWRLAAAAYNSGRGRVRRAIARAGTDDFWQLQLPRETRNYVPLLMAAAVIAKDPERFGFDPGPVDEPVTWEQVRLEQLVDLKTAARLLEVTVDRLRGLNPELQKLFTPHRPGEGYLFNVPRGKGGRFLAAFNRLPKSERRGIYEYEVSRGDNLWTIARAFDVSATELADFNGLGSGALIHPGQTLVVPIPGQRAVAPGSGVHTVRPGESLWTIARRYDVAVRDLRLWNGLANDLIRPGQKLSVGRAQLATPDRTPVGMDTPGRRQHRVRGGESLLSIARTHGITVADLRAWNGVEGDIIYPGQRLFVEEKAQHAAYTVVPGDTLYGIARRFGIEAAEIARQNNMSLTTTLLSGMELRIPRQHVD